MGLASELDIVEAAKWLRGALADAFPGFRFSVRTDRFALGEAIDVNWTDGPSEDRVVAIVRVFEQIDRDTASGEILGGGNRYAQAQRQYSQAFRAWAYAYLGASESVSPSSAYRLMRRTSFGWPVAGEAQIDD